MMTEEEMQQFREFGEVQELYHRITEELIRQRKTITTMESMTAGMIASLLTDTEGSSAVLKGAFVTYSNETKVRQGVPAETIWRYSVYSTKTAEAMASACREQYEADIGIGVTGTAGNPDPANPENSCPGVVYFAIADRKEVVSFRRNIPVQQNRFGYKEAVSRMVAEELLKKLSGGKMPGGKLPE